MKIQAIELRERGRVDLGANAPLSKPLALYVEPTSLCNMRCTFCPTGDPKLRRIRPNGFMEMAIFEKLVDDLRSWGVELRRVNLYKDGESLLHPRFAEMVRLLKSSGVTREAWIKTNGLLLEPELNRQLIESGLDFIGVSVNAVDAEGYWTVTQTKVDYEKMVEGVRDLYERRGSCRIYVKIADAGFTEGQKRKFLDDFGPISDSCAIETSAPSFSW